MSRRVAMSVSVILAVAVLAGCQPGRPSEPGTVESPSSITDQEARWLMNALAGPPLPRRNSAEGAVNVITAAGDRRFIPVLLETLRGMQVGIVSPSGYDAVVDGLERLSGRSFGDDVFAWLEWSAASGNQPPPGFTEWKGQLLGRIDPGFATFLREGVPTRIPVDQIVWGGVVVDGIPALDRPQAIPALQATYLLPDEPVFGIALGGEARAYPLRIMDWHEMANDVVGGVPFALAYCTLCGSGIAYATRLPNGSTYTFGSSGLLYESNKLMYDRNTRTLWNQFTGRPVIGDLAATDIELELLPVVLTSWGAWRDQHPETEVLDIDTGHQRQYRPGAAYADYFASADPWFAVSQRDDRLPLKARVFGLVLDGVAMAYPVDRLAERRVVNDVVGETPVVLVAARGTITVHAVDRDGQPRVYDAGAEVRAFLRSDRTFRAGPDLDTMIDGAGASWRITEDALVGPDGERMPRLNGVLAYWFGWFQFHPRTLVYGD
jgi:hypothetical protein